MRPVSASANGPGSEIEQLREDLHGRWRQATRAVMIQLSVHGLAPGQVAELLDCHPATVRRWIGRFNAEGRARGPAPVRVARLGGRQLTSRIAAPLGRPGPSGFAVVPLGMLLSAPFWWGFDLPLAWLNAAMVLPLLAAAWAVYRTGKPRRNKRERAGPDFRIS